MKGKNDWKSKNTAISDYHVGILRVPAKPFLKVNLCTTVRTQINNFPNFNNCMIFTTLSSLHNPTAAFQKNSEWRSASTSSSSTLKNFFNYYTSPLLILENVFLFQMFQCTCALFVLFHFRIVIAFSVSHCFLFFFLFAH